MYGDVGEGLERMESSPWIGAGSALSKVSSHLQLWSFIFHTYSRVKLGLLLWFVLGKEDQRCIFDNNSQKRTTVMNKLFYFL